MTNNPEMPEMPEMPDEIWAAQGKDGTTYWARHRHEALDKGDAIKQTRFVRAARPAAVDVKKIRKRVNQRPETLAGEGQWLWVNGKAEGWNDCLDYLAQHGHLTPTPTGERAEALSPIDCLNAIQSTVLYGKIGAQVKRDFANEIEIIRHALSQPVHCTCNGKIPHPLKTGKLYPASTVLCDIAGQEGNDGFPYETMQHVADMLQRCGQPLDAPVHCTGSEVQSIAKSVDSVLKEDGGFWHSCSGCHETIDGHTNAPFSNIFKCYLGSGCHECGGIGAVWDNTDYEDMARSIMENNNA
mgnify:CR=1 FL=1